MIIIFKNREEQEEVMQLLTILEPSVTIRNHIQGILCYNIRNEDFDILHNEMSSNVAGLQFVDKSDLGIIPKMLGV